MVHMTMWRRSEFDNGAWMAGGEVRFEWFVKLHDLSLDMDLVVMVVMVIVVVMFHLDLNLNLDLEDKGRFTSVDAEKGKERTVRWSVVVDAEEFQGFVHREGLHHVRWELRRDRFYRTSFAFDIMMVVVVVGGIIGIVGGGQGEGRLWIS